VVCSVITYPVDRAHDLSSGLTSRQTTGAWKTKKCPFTKIWPACFGPTFGGYYDELVVN